jgi:hypothetical protein
MKEADIQKTVVEYIRDYHPEILFTMSPAGVLSGNKQQRIIRHIQNRAMGYHKGTPDLMIFLANRGYHGLFIELKAGKNTQTDEQIEFQARAGENRYLYKLCRSFEETREVIDWYATQIQPKD